MLDELAAAVPPGADGSGRARRLAGKPLAVQEPAGPRRDRGLSLAHGPGHVFRAIYEATACGTRHILEDASAHGLKVERIFLGGGGARSPSGSRSTPTSSRSRCTWLARARLSPSGSAMAAAVAAGIYPDFDEAARAMVAIERLVEPNPANAGVYDELFAKYVDLYRRLNEENDRDSLKLGLEELADHALLWASHLMIRRIFHGWHCRNRQGTRRRPSRPRKSQIHSLRPSTSIKPCHC